MPTKGTPVRSLRVPDALWDAATAKAEAEGVNVRAVIVTLLTKWVAKPPRR